MMKRQNGTPKRKRHKLSDEEQEEEGGNSEEEAGKPDDSAIMKACPHVAGVYIDAAKNTLLDPALWSCRECNHTESCWACLSCGYVGCGRYQDSHALAHYHATHHPIVFEINTKYCHCYKCDAYLDNDNKRGDVAELRMLVEQLQTHTISESRTRSGRLLKSSSRVKLRPRDYTSDDRVSTAVKHWQLYTISRAFSQWRWFVDAHRKEGSGDDEHQHLPHAPGFSLFQPGTGTATSSTPKVEAADGWEFREENELEDLDYDGEDKILLLDGHTGGRANHEEEDEEEDEEDEERKEHHTLKKEKEEGEEAGTGAAQEATQEAQHPSLPRTPSGIMKRSGSTVGQSIRRARVSWKTYEQVDDHVAVKEEEEGGDGDGRANGAPVCETTATEKGETSDGDSNDGGDDAAREAGKKRKRGDDEHDGDGGGGGKNEQEARKADDGARKEEQIEREEPSQESTNNQSHKEGDDEDDDEDNTGSTTPVPATPQPRRNKRRRKGMLADLDMDGPSLRPQAIFLSPVARRNLVPGQTGLRNLGNTCFMNAVLQALSNTLQFRNYFVVDFLPKDKKGKLWRRKTIDCLKQITAQQPPALGEISISAEIHNIFRVVWSGRWAVVTPFALLDALWKFVPRFRNYQQQDAQEFLVYLLDKLHDELTSLNGGLVASPQSASKRQAESIISKTFRGELLSQVTCSACGNVSSRREPYLDLSLDIPVQHAARSRTTRGKTKKNVPSCSLYDCFDSFTRSEPLTGYCCEKCKSSHDATKRLVVQTLPDVLCIVLKRFCWTATTRAKVDTKVLFPLIGLDLAAFSSEEREDAIFDLRSVVIHHGSGPSAGHYTAFCYHTEQETWLHFNDSHVSVSSPQEVASAQAYLLFYQRRSASSDRIPLPTFIPAHDTRRAVEEGDAEEAKEKEKNSKRKRKDKDDEDDEDDGESDKKQKRRRGPRPRKEAAEENKRNNAKGKRARAEDSEEEEDEAGEEEKEESEEDEEDEEEKEEEERGIDEFSRDELVAALRKRGLRVTGTKPVLLRRLRDAIEHDKKADREEVAAKKPPGKKRIAKRTNRGAKK